MNRHNHRAQAEKSGRGDYLSLLLPPKNQAGDADKHKSDMLISVHQQKQYFALETLPL